MYMTISNAIIEKCPNLRLGLLTAEIYVQIENEALWNIIQTESKIFGIKKLLMIPPLVILYVRCGFRSKITHSGSTTILTLFP